MDTTTLGYPYPEGGDAVTDYPAVAQTLAEMLDDERTIEGTTIAAIAAAVGGAAKGKRALLRNARGGRMALVYDSVLAKWVSPELHFPLIAGNMTFAGTIGSGGVADCQAAAISPILEGKPWWDCGLQPQMSFRGYFGMTWSGGTTTRLVQTFAYNTNGGAGGNNPYPGGYLSYCSQIPITADNSAPELVFHDWFGVGPPAGSGANVQYDSFLPTFYITGTGTGTATYLAKNVTCGIRWVSA